MNTNYCFLVLAFFLQGCGGNAPLYPKSTSEETIRSQLSDAQKAALEQANNEKMFENADIGLWVKGERVAEVIRSINTIPMNARKVSLQITNQTDKLEDTGNYYVELYDLPSNNASGSLVNVRANWSKEGVLHLGADVTFNGNAKIHGHYKPLKVGGHVGLNLATNAKLNGQLHFTPAVDPHAFFDANFQLLPTPVSMTLSTGIADSREFCWQIGPAKDCKTLWEYKIPINISINETVKTDKIFSLPVEIKMPETIRLATNSQGLKFNKSLALNVTPKSFATNEFGIALLASVKIAEVTISTEAKK